MVQSSEEAPTPGQLPGDGEGGRHVAEVGAAWVGEGKSGSPAQEQAGGAFPRCGIRRQKSRSGGNDDSSLDTLSLRCLRDAWVEISSSRRRRSSGTRWELGRSPPAGGRLHPRLFASLFPMGGGRGPECCNVPG